MKTLEKKIIFAEKFIKENTFFSCFFARYSGINLLIAEVRPIKDIPLKNMEKFIAVVAIPYSFGFKNFPTIDQKKKFIIESKNQFKKR